MKLFSYWRSTTSFRVRAALNLKGVAYEIAPINLLQGAQRDASYAQLNPGHGVPTLVLDDGTVLTQSMAILDWLDETYPVPELLPVDPVPRARVRAAAQMLAVDTHPVNNLKVTQHLQRMGHDENEVLGWMCHWMHHGLSAFQAQINASTLYCFGDRLTQADLCLVGQLLNAKRWGVDMAGFGRLDDIDLACREIPEIADALPANQPDAE